ATVEIPSPVAGEVLWLGGNVGDVIAVGSDLVRLKVAGEDRPAAARPAQKPATEERRRKPAAPTPAAPAPPVPAAAPVAPAAPSPLPTRLRHGAPRPEGEKPLAAPAVRLRAREAGIDL